jgi:hypothetical protein
MAIIGQRSRRWGWGGHDAPHMELCAAESLAEKNVVVESSNMRFNVIKRMDIMVQLEYSIECLL